MTRQGIRSVQKSDSAPSAEASYEPHVASSAPAKDSSSRGDSSARPRHSEEQHADEQQGDEQRVSSPEQPVASEETSDAAQDTNSDDGDNEDGTARSPLPSYGTLFHEGATFGRSRGSWIPEEKPSGKGSPSAATPNDPPQNPKSG